MVLAPHQQRVLDEKVELDLKIAKLMAFIEGNPILSSLSDMEKIHLDRQLDAMQLYSCILAERIMAFESN